MAKAARQKKKTSKKSARVSVKPKASVRVSKPAKKKTQKSARPAARRTAAPKIDPLNRKQYGAVSPILAVQDIRRAVDFYQSAFGFTVRAVMDSPEGPMHAE